MKYPKVAMENGGPDENQLLPEGATLACCPLCLVSWQAGEFSIDPQVKDGGIKTKEKDLHVQMFEPSA